MVYQDPCIRRMVLGEIVRYLRKELLSCSTCKLSWPCSRIWSVRQAVVAPRISSRSSHARSWGLLASVGSKKSEAVRKKAIRSLIGTTGVRTSCQWIHTIIVSLIWRALCSPSRTAHKSRLQKTKYKSFFSKRILLVPWGLEGEEDFHYLPCFCSLELVCII